MSQVFVAGMGAVSPAGWGMAALREALAGGRPIPSQAMERPGWPHPLHVRLVPPAPNSVSFFGHARLRRASVITHYATYAVLEAVARCRQADSTPPRLGLISCLQSGCVEYSFRFFAEAVNDSGFPSPLLFPETVFAAPISHVAALLGNVPKATTLVGDPAVFLQGVALGCDWLEESEVDAVVIVGSEETTWLHADAVWHLEHAVQVSTGAGAICLTRRPELSVGVALASITDVHSYTSGSSRVQAAEAMRRQLLSPALDELLCEGTQGGQRSDAAETAAWRDWVGPRLRPKSILGEGLMAAAAWQCVAACDAIATERFQSAAVSLVGSNQQAIGARFVACKPGPTQQATRELGVFSP